MSSILDNLGQMNENDWLAQKLEDNPEEDQALQTTARIATAHIWPFLASSISDDDYRARRNIKRDEVLYICGTIAPHTASALVDHVLTGFDQDFAVMHTAVKALPTGSGFAPLPNVGREGDDNQDKGEDNGDQGDNNSFVPRRQRPDDDDSSSSWRSDPSQPGFLEAPTPDQNLEGGKGYFSWQGAGGMQNQQKWMQQAASVHAGSDVGYGTEAAPFELLSPEERTAHIAHDHNMDPSAVEGMSALGSAAMHQVLHDEAGLDVQHYHPRGDFMGSDPGISIDRYGHIRVGAYDRSRDPQLEENDDPDPDQYWSEYNNRDPEADVYEDPEDGSSSGHAEFRGGVRQRNPKNKVPNTWKTSARAGEVPDLDDPGIEDQVPPIRGMSPDDLVEHMGEYHFGPGPRRPNAEAAVQETLGLPPGRMQFVHDNAHDQGSRMHSPHAHGKGASPPEHGQPRPGKERPVKEARLATSRQRPPGRSVRPARPESGYDPSEAFPGYYGEVEGPRRPRTAQAPLSGQGDVPSISTPGSDPETPNVGSPPPQTPQSSTGASGMYDPAGALSASAPGGAVSGNFGTSDAPQDIQAQLGQVPTLSHKVGAKLAEMATEALVHNSGLTAVAAIELALKVLRLYPKVAIGGADYLAEPEPLEACPQCQRRAYNAEINRCHNCGFYDAGSEPSIEIT